ncbi:MAG TPA: TerB family tellurite resistance protein [Desulfobacterales bacterium]|nr:TerB family tellurite resistance protein [Desulfobacterales bacterium]
MFKSIKSLLGSQRPVNDKPSTRLAVTILLLEASFVDGECSPAELAKIKAAIRRQFSLTDNDAEQLISQARQKRRETVDLWQFSNQINNDFSEAQKIQIMETAWQIFYADGILNSDEDQYAHTMAKLLRLSHEQLIAAKLKGRAACNNSISR